MSKSRRRLPDASRRRLPDGDGEHPKGKALAANPFHTWGHSLSRPRPDLLTTGTYPLRPLLGAWRAPLRDQSWLSASFS